MSGRSSKTKGRKGETAAKHLLQERDWEVLADTTAGTSACDLVATDGIHVYAVEVKNREVIYTREFVAQAKKNATGTMRWMVMAHISGTSSWLVMRQAERPTVWHGRGE